MFDLDDTLYLERDYVQSGLRSVGVWVEQRFNLADFCGKAWQHFQDGERTQLFDRTLASEGISPDPRVISEMVEIYRNHVPDIELQPDVHHCLRSFSKSARLAILTDGLGNVQRKKVAALGLAAAMDHLIFTDDYGKEHWKPHPLAFEIIQQRFGFPAAEFLYIGDNPAKDFQAPGALGWSSIRIRRLGSLHYNARTPATAGVLAEIPDLGDLESVIPWSRQER